MAKSQRGPYALTSTQIQIGKMSSDQNSGCLLYIGDNIVHLEPKWPLFWLEKALFWGPVDLKK